MIVWPRLVPDFENNDFVPPPVPEMHEALDAFEGFLRAPSLLPPLLRLRLIHCQFKAIHPFPDDNGRVGRLLNSLLLCAWDVLCASPVLTVRQVEAALEVQRQNTQIAQPVRDSGC